MKGGWIKGALTGAMMGAGAVAMYTAMSRKNRKHVTRMVSDAAQNVAEKAERMIK